MAWYLHDFACHLQLFISPVHYGLLLNLPFLSCKTNPAVFQGTKTLQIFVCYCLKLKTSRADDSFVQTEPQLQMMYIIIISLDTACHPELQTPLVAFRMVSSFSCNACCKVTRQQSDNVGVPAHIFKISVRQSFSCLHCAGHTPASPVWLLLAIYWRSVQLYVLLTTMMWPQGIKTKHKNMF